MNNCHGPELKCDIDILIAPDATQADYRHFLAHLEQQVEVLQTYIAEIKAKLKPLAAVEQNESSK